jgi:outer membrane protein TolC
LDKAIQFIKTDIAKYQLVEAYEDYLAELIQLYYTWMRQYESLLLSRSAYQDNQAVFKSILNRQQKKIANDTDVNKLKLQMLAKKEQMIVFEQDYLQTSHQIKRVMGINNTDGIQPDTQIELDPLPDSIAQSLKNVQLNSRTFIILEKLKKQRVLETDRLFQDILPSARISASVVDSLETEGFVGVSVTIPMNNKRSKGKYALSKINRQKNQMETITIVEQLKTNIQNIYYALYSQQKLIDIASEKRELAFQILESETENYSYGKITLNDYIIAVNRYDSARFDEIERKIAYQKLNVEWQRLTDRLVIKSVYKL